MQFSSISGFAFWVSVGFMGTEEMSVVSPSADRLQKAGTTEGTSHVNHWKRRNLSLEIPSRTPDLVAKRMPPSSSPTPREVNFVLHLPLQMMLYLLDLRGHLRQDPNHPLKVSYQNLASFTEVRRMLRRCPALFLRLHLHGHMKSLLKL
ncbi:uncharacterized protein LOC111490959 [Cucurbita maxima]|uniref:Uncharacterized protein LOC111490959 n=1 Tax=Cucurbita maxima TaxID=3661 RepID=A0A6J1K5L0_CUCMA|nr:uncharacterized protein LOC111490959 [Cucurbita maxima]